MQMSFPPAVTTPMAHLLLQVWEADGHVGGVAGTVTMLPDGKSWFNDQASSSEAAGPPPAPVSFSGVVRFVRHALPLRGEALSQPDTQALS